jgi:hypothetical protein
LHKGDSRDDDDDNDDDDDDNNNNNNNNNTVFVDRENKTEHVKDISVPLTHNLHKTAAEKFRNMKTWPWK